ncbi:GNAT family N-acetyltransferase [Lysobacter sp. S4-A87]|uniref:GNAT family N-acetyltransferase n=1 Tax=Lysobacter sp. S4-A87 TaxID=2925843 RepID=UPI001F535E83|nr:GNAT family N-acetyltransferase [Lysobacter sp. S4-A87]UNK48099.1 GNAT family N-acetyltransferase [Lysobacter sp. S4-A87]
MPAIAPMETATRVRVTGVLDEATANAVRSLRVGEGQYRYVGDTAFNLGDSLRDPMSEAMAVLANDRVVGFYRLDFAPNAVAGRPMHAPSVGLRAFVIDHDQQGRGIGTQAMAACCADLRRRHPDRALLVLTVNCSNHAAIAAYRKAAFVDTGELFQGGSAGPQHLMLFSLHPIP